MLAFGLLLVFQGLDTGSQEGWTSQLVILLTKLSWRQALCTRALFGSLIKVNLHRIIRVVLFIM
jgi:hypothetical protein